MSGLIGQSLGRYHILEQLGEGGMATVYKAFDTRLETDVAVKVIRTDRFTPAVLTRALKRFEREAKALAKLTHPNIVKVMDYGEYEGQPYLVMPFLPGGNLKQYLRELGRLPWQEAVRLLLPIAQALEFAHSQGIIHRDVKPANILLTQNGQPMLTDFGVAKVLEEESTVDLTGTAAAVGTPEYMAPEQTGKNIDHRVDIYALGIVFYEMVTGRRPFEADTPLAVLVKQASEPLPRPSQFEAELPDAVEKVLIKALAKKPEDRYAHMGAFVKALNELGSGQSGQKLSPRMQKVPARDPDRSLQKGTKRKGKRWLPIAIATVILMILVAAGVGLYRLGQRASSPPVMPVTQTPTKMATITATQKATETAIIKVSPISPTSTSISMSTITPSMEKTVTISGRDLWQSTGITLSPGDVVTIQYISGQWGWTGELPETEKGANGSPTSCLNIAGSTINDCPLPSANEGALIARIGNELFAVGTQTSYTVPDGESTYDLALRMNDGDGGFHDNFGSIMVKVSVAQKKVAATFKSRPVDGEVLILSCTNSWEECRNSREGNANWSNLDVATIGSGLVSNEYLIQRVYLFFDTSSIPEGAKVTGAILHLYTDAFVNGNNTIDIVHSSAAIPLSTSDFSRIEFVSGGSATPSGPLAWFSITMQEDALTWIVPGGITKVALIHHYDLSNKQPTSSNDILIATSENGQHEPYLVVTYSIP